MPGHPESDNQPTGAPVPGWAPRPAPAPVTLTGTSVRLEPLGTEHCEDLFAEVGGPERASLWTYIPAVTEVESVEQLRALVTEQVAAPGMLPFAVVDLATGRAVGRCSLMRPDPLNGVVEVGFIVWGPSLQRTRGATEAQYLLARHVFDDLGYRRYEWKCDSLNAPSRRAAARLGFTEEGTFRQHLVVKGRNRDTTWFAMTDGEWPRLRAAYEEWLASTTDLAQARSLGTLTAAALRD